MAKKDAFDPRATFGGCSCGHHRSQSEHDRDTARPGGEAAESLLAQSVDAAVMTGIFGSDVNRRRFLQAVGASTALAAVSDIFPLQAARALAAESAGRLEKTKLAVGFVPTSGPRCPARSRPSCARRS